MSSRWSAMWGQTKVAIAQRRMLLGSSVYRALGSRGVTLARAIAGRKDISSASTSAPALAARDKFADAGLGRGGEQAYGEKTSSQLEQIALEARIAPRLEPFSPLRPLVALRGLSSIAFSILYSSDLSQVSRAEELCTKELVNRLQEDNDYLEETHECMTRFIEHQKDEISRLRAQLSAAQQGYELV
mmetsp:Transcript_13299/g.23647  ORF Transcript_13299/g.23647 Transcript_13299/m.23647 type:complete len:187 (-) Transcript_13299:106-666(-)